MGNTRRGVSPGAEGETGRPHTLLPKGVRGAVVSRTCFTFQEPGLCCRESAPRWCQSDSRAGECIVVFAECERAYPRVDFAFSRVSVTSIGV